MKTLMQFSLLVAVLFWIACGAKEMPTKAAQDITGASNDGNSTQSSEYKECGFINDEQINCDEGEICAVAEWNEEDGPRCYPEDICQKERPCGENDCLVLESWPAQLRCGTTQ